MVWIFTKIGREGEVGKFLWNAAFNEAGDDSIWAAVASCKLATTGFIPTHAIKTTTSRPLAPNPIGWEPTKAPLTAASPLKM